MEKLTRTQIKAMKEMIATAKAYGGIHKEIGKPLWAKETTIRKLVNLGFLTVKRVSEGKHYKYRNFGRDFIGCEIYHSVTYQVNQAKVDEYNNWVKK